MFVWYNLFAFAMVFMIIVNKLVDGNGTESQSREIDTIPLNWEDRQRSRQRVTTTAGREVGLALATGSILTPGDVLFRDEILQIVVTGKAEQVLIVSAKNQKQYGLICYQIGNLHQPISLQEDQILLPYHEAITTQLNRFGFRYVEDCRVFIPTILKQHRNAH